MTFEALCDFPDDILVPGGAWSRKMVGAFVETLAESGFSRLGWSWYGRLPEDWLVPGHDIAGFHFEDYAATRRDLGDFHPFLVESAHARGLEVFAQFKPYETGPALAVPRALADSLALDGLDFAGNTRLVWMARFVREHPELRLTRIEPDPPAALPRRIVLLRAPSARPLPPPEALRVWESETNERYSPCREELSVRPVRVLNDAAVVDYYGGPLLAAGETCDGIEVEFARDVRAKYLAFTLADAAGAEFSNSALAMVRAYAADGTPLRGSVASPNTVYWRGRTGPDSWLGFDAGFGAMPFDLCGSYSDKPAFVGWTRERSPCAAGALSESEPRVVAEWMREVRAMLAAGYDGIDLRIENHSLMCDEPDAFGRSPALADVPAAELPRVRGDHLDAFVERVAAEVRAAGRKLRIVFHSDLFRPDPLPSRRLAGCGPIEFRWRDWISRGWADEVLLFSYDLPFPRQVGADVDEVLALCRQHAVPVTLNRYIDQSTDLAADWALASQRPEIRGLVLYETASFLRWDPAREQFAVFNPRVASWLASALSVTA